MKENDDLFASCVEDLDSWNGFADGFRAYDMCELDDYYCDCKATKLLEDLTKDFNITDNYFYFSIYGLESTDDKIELYRDNVWESELLDNLLSNLSDLNISDYDSDFQHLLEVIEISENQE